MAPIFCVLSFPMSTQHTHTDPTPSPAVTEMPPPPSCLGHPPTFSHAPLHMACRSEPRRRTHVPMPTHTHPPSKTTATHGLFLLPVHVLPKCIFLPFCLSGLEPASIFLSLSLSEKQLCLPPFPTPPSTIVSLHLSAAKSGPTPPSRGEASTPLGVITASSAHLSHCSPLLPTELGSPC